MALTTAEIAVALRVTTDLNAAPAEPLLSILHRQLQTAVSLIESQASGAPEHVKDEAAIRLTGYLYEQVPTGNASQNPLRHSGALALLSPYIVFTGASTGTAVSPMPVTPETGLNPSHPVHVGTHFRYAGWSDDGVIAQAELDSAAQFTGDVLTVPSRSTNGYFFFGVDETPGYPDSILLDGNPTNQITNFLEQAAQLSREGNTVIIGISTADLSAALSGRMWTLGYVSP